MVRKALLFMFFSCLVIGYGQRKSRAVQRPHTKARAAPRVLNYQGYLTDTLGSPLDDTLGMTFTIYDAETDGNELWTETQSLIHVERGVFSVLLGSVHEIPDSVFFQGTARWLELILESTDTLSPRTRITAMAYAYTATHADTADYALATPLGGVPSDYCILGASGTPPAGYTYTQNYVTAAEPSVNVWTTKADMLADRSYLGAASVGGKIYAIGGYPSQHANEEYDPVTNTWTMKEGWEFGELGCGVAAVNGKIYALGGHGNRRTNTEYDPATNSWTEKADMPTGRHSFAAAGVNGKVYAIGGYDEMSVLQTNEEYDPVSNSWATKANLSGPRYGVAAAVVNGKIYVIGGRYGSTYFALNEEYDPATNNWTGKAGMPTARYYLAAAAVNGKIYAIGGWNPDSMYLATTEEYNPVTNTWSTKPDMPTPRMALAAAEAGGKIYAVGGENLGSQVDANEEYGAGVVFYYIHRKN
jgi:N-acetylneuraminic acid mutarotase